MRIRELSRYFAWSALALALVIPAARAEDGPTPPKIDLSYRNEQPMYPAGALDRREHGDTVLTVDVDDDGRPTNATVTVSSGFADLDQTAVAAARHYRYVAATDGRHDVAGSMTLIVRFQLSPPPFPGVRASDVFALRTEDDRVICRRQLPPLGSMISPPPVCHTKQEWDDIARHTPDRTIPDRRPGLPIDRY